MAEQNDQQTNQNAAAEAVVPAVPNEWPGAFGLYKYSKAAVRFNLGAILIVLIASTVVTAFLNYKAGMVGGVLAFLVSIVSEIAFTRLYIDSVRRQKQSVGGALSQVLPLFVKSFLLGLLVTLVLIGSLLLLIIPFFFVLPRVMLGIYFLVDQKLGPVEAFKASWHTTKGHAWQIWKTLLVNIVYILPAFTIIGIPIAIYLLVMYIAAPAVLYEMWRGGAQPVAPAPTAAPAAPVA